MANEIFQNIVRDWTNAVLEGNKLEKEVAASAKRRKAAAELLARAIIPRDVKQGETISVWVSTGRRTERLITVKWMGGDNYDVHYRGDEREQSE